MNNVGNIVFRKINRISPSQFYSMKNCGYKSLLAEAFDKKPLLPVSQNAYFGTVLHKMLELIAKRVILNEDDFNKIFDEQVKLQEENLRHLGYDFFVPLQKNVKDFGIKKILLKKHLRYTFEKSEALNEVKFFSEKWFASKDGLIGGKIDLVIEEGKDVEIIDFKTGEIKQDVLDDNGEISSEIKEEYKVQLKLYAYLYFETTGKFPTQLSLINLTKQKVNIDFTMNECCAIFEDAKLLLKSTNNCIDKGVFAGNPTEANCKYCLYRPACLFYWKYIETDNLFNDVSGTVQKIVKFQNGNVSMILKSGDKTYTVSNFPSERFDELNNNRNKKIYVFNLKKESRECFYSAIKTTIVYG